MLSKSGLLKGRALGAAAALAGVAFPILAQQAGSNAGNGASDALDEVVVIAQRRQERLQDVPISVTALSAPQLQSRGVVSTNDLTMVTPGLTMTETSSFVQPFIRGIGSLTTSVGDQSSVATYIDGVYMPLVQTGVYDLANVSSVEVLKGPQGTLFGRNAMGGAILITTEQPQDKFGGHFDVSYGNFNAANAHGYLTGPIANGVSASLAVSYNRHDGWVDDLYTGKKIGDAERYNVRGTVLIEPSSRLSVTLTGYYLSADDPNGVINSPVGGYLTYTPGSLLPNRPDQYVGNIDPSQTSRQSGASGRLVYHFDSFDFTSVSAYQHLETRVVFDNDSTPQQLIELLDTEKGDVFSQELQLQSTGTGPLRWMIGAFYYNQRSSYAPLDVLIAPATTLDIGADHHDKAYAGFADGTYKLGDFELTAGVRYNHEAKDLTAELGGFTVIDGAHDSWNSTTPRAVLAYKPSASLLTYVSYTQGFKSGAYNVSGLSNVPVNPEHVNAYEAGVKWQVNPALSVDTAAFLYNTSDLQVQTIDPVTGLQLLANAASSRSKGADLDVSWKPVQDLHLQFGASYLNAKYTSFRNAPVYIPAGGPSGGLVTASQDVSGDHLVRSPDWTFNLAASYSIPLADLGRIEPSVNLFNSSSFYWDFNNRVKTGGYTMLNGQLSWHLPGDGFSISLWGRNLTDKRVYRSALTTSITDQVVWNDPRTYGVRLSYAF